MDMSDPEALKQLNGQFLSTFLVITTHTNDYKLPFMVNN